MANDNPFQDLDAATLQTLKTKTLDAIQAVLLNSSYSLNGKSVTRDSSRLNPQDGATLSMALSSHVLLATICDGSKVSIFSFR